MICGSNKISIREIAATADLSVAPVSYALRGTPGGSEETRKKILTIAESLGYRPDPLPSYLMYHATDRMHFNSAPDSLYRYLAGEAYSLLDERNRRVRVPSLAGSMQLDRISLVAASFGRWVVRSARGCLRA